MVTNKAEDGEVQEVEDVKWFAGAPVGHRSRRLTPSGTSLYQGHQ